MPQQKPVKWLMEKLTEAELEMKVSICELEKGEALGEEEGIIDGFMNCWTNAD